MQKKYHIARGIKEPNILDANKCLDWFLVSKLCRDGDYDHEAKKRIIISYINSSLWASLILKWEDKHPILDKIDSSIFFIIHLESIPFINKNDYLENNHYDEQTKLFRSDFKSDRFIKDFGWILKEYGNKGWEVTFPNNSSHFFVFRFSKEEIKVQISKNFSLTYDSGMSDFLNELSEDNEENAKGFILDI